MKKTAKASLCLLSLVVLHSVFFTAVRAGTIDLSGQWDFEPDPASCMLVAKLFGQPFSDTINLPGTTAQAQKCGSSFMPSTLPVLPLVKFDPKKGLLYGRDMAGLTNSALAHLYENFPYVGTAWYRREVNIPADWTNQDVQLVLERAMWQTRVWVNGRFIGQQNSLTTPHRYEIGPALKPGGNEIIIRVDNRRQLEIGEPHAYTEQAPTIWNGIIGRIALEARNKIRMDGLQLRPSLERNGVEVTVQTYNGTGASVTAQLCLQATPENFHARKTPELKLPVVLAPGDGEQKIFYPMGTNYELWSEFNSKLYRLQGTLTGKDDRSQFAGTFGMREFKAAGRQFALNGQPVFLRGTVNCCEFPETGYPDMTAEQWQKIFSIVKACGLNHVRFHTWCPPEIAFELADHYGIYLETELPDWCFKIGQDTNVTKFFQAEGRRMIQEYGNHPSWVMLTMGNELKGDYKVLNSLDLYFRQVDPQLLYACSTYPSNKIPEPADDYYISQDTKKGRARGQDIFEDNRPNTETNFSPAASAIKIPLISHEVGQYCVYPNLAEIPKYKGVLRAPGFEAIRADLETKNRLAEAPVYTRASGELAVLLYKEEIERALRTTNQAGFQLLQLNDFPGQGTSTVGLYDAFWDSKGLITPPEFKKFCAPVVLLVTMPKRTYQNDEVFAAGIQIANFGPAPMTNAAVVWKIFDGKKEIGSGSSTAAVIPQGNGIPLGRIRQPLSAVTHAAELKLTVRVGKKIENDWSFWVYPKKENPSAAKIGAVEIFQTAGTNFYDALRDGKRVLLLPSRSGVKSPLAAQFGPVFWNPVMFPNQPETMGAMIDARHPAFAEFPTDPWTNWQWWELLHDSFAIDLDEIPVGVTMPFRFVDKFNRNALPAAIFEAQVGRGKLLVCTLDLTSHLDHRVAARQLRRSIVDYMSSKKFQPQVQLSADDLQKLFL